MPINYGLNPFLPLIDGAIQAGRGAAATVLGQMYTVYRNPTTLTGSPSTVSNSVTASTPIALNFHARMQRTTTKSLIENATFDLLVYVGTCDKRTLQPQDVLVETGYGADGGVFTFVQERPTQANLFIRTESACSITRPNPGAGSSALMPTSGNYDAPGYGGIPKSAEAVLTLTNGFYSFSSANGATPASVYCGVQPMKKIRDGNTLGTPTDNPRNDFVFYVPLLPGEMIDIGDRLSLENQDRYEISQIYTTDLTGVSGYILFSEKLGT